MRPYRTCGSSGGFFFFLNFPKIDQIPFIPLRTSPKKSKKTSSENTFFKNSHSVADVPKKVEKTSSENTTFENSMRPYRTCGHRPEPLISGLPPLCLIYDPKPIVPLRTSLKKSKKTPSKNITFKNSMRPYRTCGSGGSCGIIFKLFSARCFLQKYGRSDPLAQNR